MFSGYINRNPAETIELGSRVVWALSEEKETIEATKHYANCTNNIPTEPEGCGFCFYGPVDDFETHLIRLKFDSRPHLGQAWEF